MYNLKRTLPYTELPLLLRSQQQHICPLQGRWLKDRCQEGIMLAERWQNDGWFCQLAHFLQSVSVLHQTPLTGLSVSHGDCSGGARLCTLVFANTKQKKTLYPYSVQLGELAKNRPNVVHLGDVKRKHDKIQIWIVLVRLVHANPWKGTGCGPGRYTNHLADGFFHLFVESPFSSFHYSTHFM